VCNSRRGSEEVSRLSDLVALSGAQICRAQQGQAPWPMDSAELQGAIVRYRMLQGAKLSPLS
jgi:hypothetical protein